MRKNIHTITFSFDNSSYASLMFNSLKYSTHNFYHFIGLDAEIYNKDYNYIYFDYVKDFKKTNCHVTINGQILKYPNTSHRFANDDIKDSEISSKVTHYFINGATNGVDYLFSVRKQEGIVLEIFVCHKTIILQTMLTRICENWFIFAMDEYTNKSMVRPTCENDIHAFDQARLFGINIPLLIVQDLMNRKFRTVKMVDDHHIDLTANTIRLPHKKIYLDLDETLIWDDLEIRVTRTFYEKAASLGIPVYLITRHKKDVAKTLKKIDMQCSNFEDIYIVPDHELKSIYIPHGSIFIDNEFPQRLDVRKNTNSTVLDLDILNRVEFDD